MRLVVEIPRDLEGELDMLEREKWYYEFEQEMPEWSFIKGERRRKQAKIVILANKIRTLKRLIED